MCELLTLSERIQPECNPALPLFVPRVLLKSLLRVRDQLVLQEQTDRFRPSTFVEVMQRHIACYEKNYMNTN